MKSPDEIKKGLERCNRAPGYKDCKNCPYFEILTCTSELRFDTLALIQQLEAKVTRWISVEERLPEADGKYIVCTAKRSVYCTKFRAYGRGGSFQTDINTHITHWMPLPKPPKED